MKLARWSVIPLMLALCACSLFKRDEQDAIEEPAPPKGPELVGRIASIAADRRFVLIQSFGTWNNQAGTILTTRGAEERAANLLVTGESLGQFTAADIQSGSVEIGDAVYSHHAPKPAEAPLDRVPESEVSDEQSIALPENVQKNN